MNDLLKGLSILYDMELNDYLMLQTIKKLNYEINLLGYHRDIKVPERNKTAHFDFGSLFIFVIIGSLIFGIWKSVEGFIEEEGLFDRIIGFIASGIVGLILGAIIGAAIGLTILVLKYLAQTSSDKAKNNRDWLAYQNELNFEEAKYQKQCRQKELLIVQRDILDKKQKDSLKKLIKFYDMIGIDNNYRNLIPISYMYELCRLGVSNKLTGTDGLYYLVRKELRGDKLQYSLDEISNKLDTIISKQNNIYTEISEINNKCDVLLAQTKKSIQIAAENNQLINTVVNNTSISNYHLKRIQRELEFQNTMEYIYRY